MFKIWLCPHWWQPNCRLAIYSSLWYTVPEIFTKEVQWSLLWFHLRIVVHFFGFHWKMKRHWSRVNLVRREVLLKDWHTTSVLSFPNANEQKFTSILIFMLKRWKTPKKSKNPCEFFHHVTSVFHWEIFARFFLCFIAWGCHGSINIKAYEVPEEFSWDRISTGVACKQETFTIPRHLFAPKNLCVFRGLQKFGWQLTWFCLSPLRKSMAKW